MLYQVHNRGLIPKLTFPFKRKKKHLALFLLFFAIGFIFIFALISIINRSKITGTQSRDVIYTDTYRTINSIVVKKDKDQVLIDLRPSDEYGQQHFKNTLNIPVLADKINSEAVLKEVKKKVKSDKSIVILQYSMYSTSGEEVYSVLKKAGYSVKLLKAGWNELYSFPNIWVPQYMITSFNMFDYIQSDDNTSK